MRYRCAIVLMMAFGAIPCSAAWAQSTDLAAEGIGLLPAPATAPTAIAGEVPAIPFQPDPAGGFSRTVFQSDEDANFKVVIKEYSFPPDGRTHTLTLPAAAVLHFAEEPGRISVANETRDVQAGDRTAVAAGAPIEFVNTANRPVVVHVLTVEAK